MDDSKIILIGKYLSGNATDEERENLERWLREDPANKKELKKTEQLWENSARLKVNKMHDASEAWEDFKIRAKARPSAESGAWLLRAAASIAFIMIAAIVIRLVLDSGDDTKVATKPAISQPAPARQPAPVIKDSAELFTDTLTEQKTTTAKKGIPALNRISTTDSAIVFLLPDNSKVYLNKNSSLSFPNSFGQTERRVTVSGEAFFEVNHLGTPFLVACGKTIVHDIGTSFNVKGSAKDSLVEVSVITGSVEFYAVPAKNKTAEIMQLKAGSSGIYHVKAATIEKTKNKKGSKWWKSKGIKNKLRAFFDKLTNKKRQ